MAGANGGVFSFGIGGLLGSPVSSAGRSLRARVGRRHEEGKGYWLFGADGGVFTYGDAGYLGALPALGVKPSAPSWARRRSTARGTGW